MVMAVGIREETPCMVGHKYGFGLLCSLPWVHLLGLLGDNDDVENFANQHLGATYAMTERYYTQNGLPIDEDIDF